MKLCHALTAVLLSSCLGATVASAQSPPVGNAATQAGPNSGKPAPKLADTPLTRPRTPIFLNSMATPIRTSPTLPLPREPHTTKPCFYRDERRR